ncbi:LysE family transporter [Vibrio lentus]|uniref:Threonine efflux protein n=1 Tax=Vibrio lentus TaxID=136468 RepID=A0AB36XJK2_9VIBR|nr:LysE family transporter [Vibrio lentus]MCC4838238.1 LysE family transporter [Vibrio lentus]PMI12073.1 threonine efflux protein [Vibrio lentus]PMK36363.1 threonine efflux protein [Vibrio lentus]PMK44340.1 threonine efflux protein [Vibrio lentus]PML32965.1 threonine efflux protein [Vibrio lentus]
MILVTSYALLVSLGIMSPGPGFIHTVTQAITGTKWSTFKVVSGLAIANLVISTIGVIGGASLLLDPRTATAITLIGCVYLLFVAYKLLLTSVKTFHESTMEASFASSFIIQVSNIKAILFITSAVTININTALSFELAVLIPIVTCGISFIWYGLVGFTFQVPKVSRFLKTKIWLLNKVASVVILYLVIQLLLNMKIVF